MNFILFFGSLDNSQSSEMVGFSCFAHIFIVLKVSSARSLLCSFTHNFDLNSCAFCVFSLFFFQTVGISLDSRGSHKYSWFLGFLLKSPVSEKTPSSPNISFDHLLGNQGDTVFFLRVRYQNISCMTPLAVLILESLLLK